MAKITHRLSQILQKFDMFPTTQFLRYKQNGEFKTSTGGLISIGIIIVFVILFYQSGVQTMNQEIINSSASTQIQVQPERTNFSFRKGPQFMFSFGIRFINLSNSSKKYFNISLTQNRYGSLFSGNNFTKIPLTPCTADHFSYSEDILNLYYKSRLGNYLCPPLDYDFTVGGRLISNLYQSLNLVIQYCNKTIDPTCASDSQVLTLQNKYGGFSVYVPVISTVINGGDSKYKQVFIQQRNLYYFTITNGLWMNARIQETQVNTDVSLMPISDIKTEVITTIPQLFLVKPTTVYSGKYVEIVFDKSKIKTIYTRSFNKIDDYFSYVGGLVGTALMIFFILSSYSQKAYVISIASDIYKIDDQKSQTKDFNFFYFVAMGIKKGFGAIGVLLKWQQSSIFQKTVQEMQKQLNVNYLLRRINYFEEAITSILNEHQIKILYFNEKKTIEGATIERKKSKRLKTVQQKQFKIENGLNLQKLPEENDKNESKCSFAALQPFQRQPDLQVANNDDNSQSDKDSRQQEISINYANSLAQIIQESNQGNRISQRILQKVSKAKYPQVQLVMVRPNETGRRKRIEGQQVRDNIQKKENSLIPFQFQEEKW